MAKFRNHYACTECGQHWIDEWSCACDDRCSNCNTPMSPYFYEELVEKAEADEETEEECEARLRRISEEVKADMKAGRYRHGQLRPEISAKNQVKREDYGSWQSRIMGLMMSESLGTMTGRFTRPTLHFHEMYGGRKADFVIMDEWSDIRERMWLPVRPREPRPIGDWKHPIPVKGPETPPSEVNRAKLRAKRKKRK